MTRLRIGLAVIVALWCATPLVAQVVPKVDTDDGSIAGGQVTTLNINLSYLWNGTTWAAVPGDATNGLKVNCVLGCSSTAIADGSAYTAGTTNGTPFMGARDDTSPGVLAEDKVGIARMSTRRELFFQIRDAAGNERGANVTANGELLSAGAKTNNTAAPTTDLVGVMGAIASAANQSYTEGRLVLPRTNLFGAQPVWIQNPNGTDVTYLATIPEASSEAYGAVMVPASVYLKADNGSSFSRLRSRAGLIGSSDVGLVTRPFVPSDGTNTMPTMDNVARPGFQKITDGTSTAVIDPCQGNAKVYTPFSVTTGTQLITGTSAKKIYICSIVLVTATAQNIAIVAGTGTVCATSTVGVFGGTTAATGWNLAANGGATVGSGVAAIGATTVNADNLCLLTSSTGQISGNLTSVVQ